MKKTQKRNFLITIISAIVTIFGVLNLGGAAQATEITNISGLDGGDAIVTNSQGQKVDPAKLPGDGWTGYNISYKWAVPDSVNISDGDTAVVTLPSGMTVNQDTSGVVKNSNGEIVGTVKFNKGSSEGTVTFNGKLHNQYGKHGTLSVTAVKKAPNSSGGSSNGGGTGLTWGINKSGWIDKSTEKNGVPTKLYWDIVVNPLGQSVDNVTVTDTIGSGQVIDKNSVKIYSITYTPGQENYRTGQLSGSTSINGNKVTFGLGNINTPVEIEYETDITDIKTNGGNLWGNQASVTTSTPNTGWTRTEDSATVNWGTGGTAQGYAGKVVVTKVDSTDTTKVLPGAVFALENSNGDILDDRLITGKDGKITVNDLPDGKYRLIETRAPEGYKLSPFRLQLCSINLIIIRRVLLLKIRLLQ